jgi:ribosomal protein S1
LKQLNAHPWDALDAKLAIGDKVKGKVVVLLITVLSSKLLKVLKV